MTATTISGIAALRERLGQVRSKGGRVAVVPTMGALHEGHLSLVREATKWGEEVVVTIFVNPTQFGPGEDFERYPRRLEEDTRLAGSAGASVVFSPSTAEMYPQGEQTRVRVTGLSQGLCGASRPHHFEGVATVVTKLMNVVGPGAYIFGKKDYQQWRLIETMARDLLLDVRVVGMPIVREADGLAMSSRNAYLSLTERSQALSLSRGLERARDAFERGERDPELLIATVRRELEHAKVEIDYIELRLAEDLATVTPGAQPPWVLAVAAHVGATRLIDNQELGVTVGSVAQSGLEEDKVAQR